MTPRRLLLSPRAAIDLEEIAEYIARDNPVRAASFVAELEAKCRAVAETPELYPARTESGASRTFVLAEDRSRPPPSAASRAAGSPGMHTATFMPGPGRGLRTG